MSTTKSSQARSVMGALESSIETLRILKGKMVDTSASNHQMHWAIGSIVIILVSGLLSISGEVIGQTMANSSEGEADAQRDLREIQMQFNEFIERMLANS